MLHFNTQSWHYRLVLYVFGKNFFLERDTVDYEATEKKRELVWTKKPKVINFCPYCRGVLWSTISLPFVFVWRLYPHKPAEERTHEEVMKRMKRRGILIRSIGGSVQFPFALMNYLQGSELAAAINIIAGVGIMASFAFLPGNKHAKKILMPVFLAIGKIFDFISKHWPKKKEKDLMPPKIKNPSLVREYLHEKHSVICPPVCFIEKVDQENLR